MCASDNAHTPTCSTWVHYTIHKIWFHNMQEGDKVYVMKEEEGMCLGICNNCFGKFPKNILKPLSTDEVIHSELPYVYTCQYNFIAYGATLSCTSGTRKASYLYIN